MDYNAAKAAGYSDQEIQQFAQQNNLQVQNQTPQGSPPPGVQAPGQPNGTYMPSPSSGMSVSQPQQQQPQQQTAVAPTTPSFMQQTPLPGTTKPKGFWDGVVDWLPTIGAVGGGILGSVVAPGAGSVVGAGAGGALGEGIKESIQGKKLDPGQIALQGGMGAIGEGVGGLVAKGAGHLLGSLGDVAATNGLNITRLSQGKFATQFGEPIAKTLQENGLAGVDREGLMGGISKVQDQFNKVANADIPVPSKVIQDTIIPYIKKFTDSPVSSVKAVGQKMLQEVQNLAGKYPDGITLAELNKARQAFDKATTDSQFGSEIFGVNRAVGQMLRDTTRNAGSELETQGLLPGGSQLKDMGHNLNKLYDIADRSAGRESSGGGGSPWSVTNLLAEMAGGGGFAAMGGNPILGGLAGFAARKFVSNPAVAQAMSPGLTAAGDAVGGAAGKMIGGALGAGAATGVTGAIQDGTGPGGPGFANGSPAFPGSQSGMPAGITKDPTTGGFTLPPLQATGVQQIYTPQAYATDMAKASGDPVTQDQLTKIFKASQDTANSFIDKNGLSPSEQENMRNAYNTNYLANDVRTLMNQVPPGFLGKFKDYQQLASYNNGQYAALGTALQRLQAEVGKQLQGGVLRGYDINVLSVTPQLGDSPEAAAAKLDQVQTLLGQQYMNLYGKYGMNTQTQPGASSPGGFTPGQ